LLIIFRQGILDWVMDSTKRDNKEVQEKMMALQKEKDQVRKQAIICINTRAGSVQKLDNAIHRINHYPPDKSLSTG